MEKREAIEYLKSHIRTYQYQLTDKGWEKMVRAGIVKGTFTERAAFAAEANRKIGAFEMAIQALENSGDDWTDRCYLGSPCPYQHQ